MRKSCLSPGNRSKAFSQPQVKLLILHELLFSGERGGRLKGSMKKRFLEPLLGENATKKEKMDILSNSEMDGGGPSNNLIALIVLQWRKPCGLVK